MRSSRQLISAHLLVEFHTLQEVGLLLASLLLGGYRHVLVSLKGALCLQIGTVARSMSLLES